MYAEDFEFLDTLVHIHVHMVTARHQDYNDGTHCHSIQQIMALAM